MSTPSAQYSLTHPRRDRRPPGHARRWSRARSAQRRRRRSAPSTSSRSRTAHCVRDITVDASDAEHWDDDRRARSSALDGVDAWSTPPTARSCCTSAARSSSTTSTPLKTRDDLSMAYTPGVARVCQAIAEDPDKAFQYTIKRNTVAVVSDGTAVLGLGDIGPRAAMPVMEGKAMLFKEFAGVDAFPICLDTKDPDEIVATVKRDRADVRRHQPRGHLRAALLRDRGAAEGRARHPRLPRRPARHRGRRAGRADQRLQADRPALDDLRVLVVGLGAAGVAVTQDPAWRRASRHIIGCDSRGALSRRARRLPRRLDARRSSAGTPRHTNPERRARHAGRRDRRHGPVHRPLRRARRSRPRRSARMNHDAMVFAMANPNPEVTPEEAAPLRAHHRHRPLGLPEPDQQRARLPRHLPRRARRARARRSPRR